jgi:hypothetical protein
MKLALSDFSHHEDEGRLYNLTLHPEHGEENYNQMCQEMFDLSYEEIRKMVSYHKENILFIFGKEE